jgi:hypothetical protein
LTKGWGYSFAPLTLGYVFTLTLFLEETQSFVVDWGLWLKGQYAEVMPCELVELYHFFDTLLEITIKAFQSIAMNYDHSYSNSMLQDYSRHQIS